VSSLLLDFFAQFISYLDGGGVSRFVFLAAAASRANADNEGATSLILGFL